MAAHGLTRVIGTRVTMERVLKRAVAAGVMVSRQKNGFISLTAQEQSVYLSVAEDGLILPYESYVFARFLSLIKGTKFASEYASLLTVAELVDALWGEGGGNGGCQ